jgi:hypothetical protein
MQGSNDGGLTWDDLDTVTGQTSWSSNETRNFVCDTRTTYYQTFRIRITANNGDGTYTSINELYLYGTFAATTPADFAPHNMSANNAPSPFVASASSEFGGSDPNDSKACQAFDGLADRSWIGTGGGVDWLKLDIGSGNSEILQSYDIVFKSGVSANRAPKDWKMQGSNDNSSWADLDTVTSETGWTVGGEKRTYVCDVATTAYRYFRLNITDNNGDATYTEVAELYLYVTGGGGGPVAAQPQMFVVCM